VIAISLQSGSNGNCIYVEADGVKLLFDAGISGRRAQQRLTDRGRDIRTADALIISHDHADHVCCAGIYQRKFGLPIHATARTLTAARKYTLGLVRDVRHFKSGQRLRFGSVVIETIPTPHDGADGAVFVVDDGHRRLGILTDLGHVFSGLDKVIGSLDAVLIESNYDPAMLASGPYPAFLKQRIRGPGGHISNVEAAQLLAAGRGRRMKWACLAHLSEQNNRPELALRTHRKILGAGLDLRVATRYEATEIMEV
jgi:phosphoribosyl 1,2-cyclic phosphodiesterase